MPIRRRLSLTVPYFFTHSVLDMNTHLLTQKGTFLAQVYSNLLFQFIVFYLTFSLLRKNNALRTHLQTYFLVYTLFFLVVSLLLIFAPLGLVSRFLLFTLFSLLAGVLFLRFRLLPDDVITSVFYQVGGAFLIMTLVGFLSTLLGYNLAWLGLALLFGLIGLLVFQIVNILGQEREKRQKGDILSRIGVVIFTLYILYDTNAMLQRDYRGDFIQAGLNLFLDSINLIADTLNLQSSS